MLKIVQNVKNINERQWNSLTNIDIFLKQESV